MRLLTNCEPSDIDLNPKLLSLCWDNALHELQMLHTMVTPIHKLQRILFFMDAIHTTLETQHNMHDISRISADDMLPLVIHLLVKTQIDSFEVDSELMWGLLEPNLMAGEAGYYCTTFTVAVNAIRTFDPQSIPRLRLPTVVDVQVHISFSRVASSEPQHFSDRCSVQNHPHFTSNNRLSCLLQDLSEIQPHIHTLSFNVLPL
eukprot:m.73085 g.73085  ORF g.73085 m.73085 type:complete len:203 (+) comp8411_c0_seq4:2404-3012(+)